MRAGLQRVPVPQPARQQSRVETIPSPSRGWIANENLSRVKPGAAFQLDNWVPTLTGARLRKGTQLFATTGTVPVTALFTYRSGVTKEIFAADATKIFDISSVADPAIAPAAAVSSQTGGDYSTFQFEVAGGDYLYCLNGLDSPQLYNGSAWAAVTGVSSIAITNVTTSLLIQGWVYRNRIYMVETLSMSAWYLPVDAVGGAATEISLRGVFQLGGKLLFGSTWSLDAGDGIDDKCVFVSDQGEVAVYEGSYPGDSTWSLVGVYQITKPLGKNAHFKAGGDLLIMTNDGIVPISQALTKDKAALSLAAITRNIEPEWIKEIQARSTYGPWEMMKWPSHNIAIIALPGVSTESPRYCFIVNLETGSWARWTGLDVQVLALHDEHGYFGTQTGTVVKMETTGADQGVAYTCVHVPHFMDMKAPARDKTVHMARATFRASVPFTPQMSASVNYIVSLPAVPAATASNSTNVWDTAVWDTDLWDGAGVFTVTARWVSIGESGFVVAPQVQVTCGDTVAPDAELISIDVLYELGEVVV